MSEYCGTTSRLPNEHITEPFLQLRKRFHKMSANLGAVEKSSNANPKLRANQGLHFFFFKVLFKVDIHQNFTLEVNFETQK